MGDRRIPIRQGGKVVGYINPSRRLRLWHVARRWAMAIRRLLRRQRRPVGNRRWS